MTASTAGSAHQRGRGAVRRPRRAAPRRPAGPPPRASSRERSAARVAGGEGFQTTVLPRASAGAILPHGIANGLFQGVISGDDADAHAAGRRLRAAALGLRQGQRGGAPDELRGAPDLRLALRRPACRASTASSPRERRRLALETGREGLEQPRRRSPARNPTPVRPAALGRRGRQRRLAGPATPTVKSVSETRRGDACATVGAPSTIHDLPVDDGRGKLRSRRRDGSRGSLHRSRIAAPGANRAARPSRYRRVTAACSGSSLPTASSAIQTSRPRCVRVERRRPHAAVQMDSGQDQRVRADRPRAHGRGPGDAEGREERLRRPPSRRRAERARRRRVPRRAPHAAPDRPAPSSAASGRVRPARPTSRRGGRERPRQRAASSRRAAPTTRVAGRRLQSGSVQEIGLEVDEEKRRPHSARRARRSTAPTRSADRSRRCRRRSCPPRRRRTSGTRGAGPRPRLPRPRPPRGAGRSSRAAASRATGSARSDWPGRGPPGRARSRGWSGRRPRRPPSSCPRTTRRASRAARRRGRRGRRRRGSTPRRRRSTRGSWRRR